MDRAQYRRRFASEDTNSSYIIGFEGGADGPR
jgi:hypothetical protein